MVPYFALVAGASLADLPAVQRWLGVLTRAALAATLLLPPWKASDGWILASDRGEVCGDLRSPSEDEVGILEFNTVSKYGNDGSEHPPTFAKCRIDLATGRAGCVPKTAHPCAEAKF